MAGGKTSIRSLVRDTYKNMTLRSLYPSRYRAALRQDVVPGRVVFLEIRGKELTDNFRMIRIALEKWNQRFSEENAVSSDPEDADPGGPDGGSGKFVWTMSVVCIREGMENRGAVMKNCLAAIPQLAQAQFIFVNESSYFLSCLPIRPETTVIQTWHACGAFKKFGYSAVGTGFGTTREDLEAYPVHRNFSYVTVSAPEVVWAYAQAFHMEDRVERILPIGVSRTDMFFSRKFREKAFGKTRWVLRRMAPELFPAGDVYTDQVTERDGEGEGIYAGDSSRAPERTVLKGKKVLLYAPTFRGTVGRAMAPEALDIPMMKRFLEGEYILLINHHPFIRAKDRPKIPGSCSGFAFDMTDRLSIEELLTVADVCITDYSSLIFEYSLFERPVVFFAYDMESYLDERGFYYHPSEMMPGPVCRTTREVVDMLSREDAAFDLARVREFKYRFMSGCDGHATWRLMKLMERCMGKKDE